MNLQQVKDRYQKHVTLCDSLREEIDTLQDQKDDLEQQHEDLVDQIDIQERSIEVMKELVEKMFKESIEEYKSLIQEGLNQIFYDRMYDFDIEIGSRGSNKTAKLLYKQKKAGEWSNWRNLDEGAGAVRCVVDLISRLFLITKTGRKRFVLFDESLSQISKNYTDRVLTFLEGMSEKLGFKFLMVTHDERYIEKVERVYEMEEGSLRKLNQ